MGGTLTLSHSRPRTCSHVPPPASSVRPGAGGGGGAATRRSREHTADACEQQRPSVLLCPRRKPGKAAVSVSSSYRLRVETPAQR